MRSGPLFAVTLGLLVAGCGPRTTANEPPHALLTPLGPDAPARVDLRQFEARPRLALVAREGDPAPALVLAVATEAGPAATVALAALVEARLRARGFAVESRAARDSFYVRWASADGRLPAFFAALREAFETPVDPRAPDTASAAEHIAALRRSPLDAPELVPIVACTGALGAELAELTLDPTSAAGAARLDALRFGTLHAGRSAIGVVGSAGFTNAALRAMENAPGFRLALPPSDPPQTADSLGVYALPSGTRPRLSLSVRAASPTAAVGAAERLGESDSPLSARLFALDVPFRLAEVSGTARPRGGCVALTLEPLANEPASDVGAAGIAAAVARREVELALALPDDPLLAARQVLLAPEAVEAASRAAWWALVAPGVAGPSRAALALGLPAERSRASELDKARRDFSSALDRAASQAPAELERKSAIERGQGEVWVLLGSPCGVATESGMDAGLTALGALAAASEGATADVVVEPWIHPEGIGILAHTAALGGREALAAAAHRAGDAAARALAAAALSAPTIERARASTLAHLDASWGPRTLVASAFADALVPDHPSWALPFGPWARVSAHSSEAVTTHWRSLAASPLRLVVLANADASQVALAANAVQRWLAPRGGRGAPCTSRALPPARPGKTRRTLPRGADAQLLIALPAAPRGAPGHDGADILAYALDGPDGALAEALRSAGVAARGSVRFLGSPAAAVLLDVRVPALGADAAFAAVDALLSRLAKGELSAATLTRAAEAPLALDLRAQATPRARIEALWGPAAPPKVPVSPEALRALAASLAAEDKRIVVEGRPE
jgi:hypothetical protein